MNQRERRIKEELARVRAKLRAGDESEFMIWPIPDTLACAQRPLRYHPVFGGRTPLPREARDLVVSWVDKVWQAGVRSVICLLEPRQLDRYYVRGHLELHEGGLLGYYRTRGFDVRHLPMTDYQPPSQADLARAYEAFRGFPKAVLIHCSAGIDRTAPVAAFIVSQEESGID